MGRDRGRCWAGLALLVLLVGSGAATAQVAVVIDGQALSTSAPPREVEGRILVGMRDIFERLGAQVGWTEAEQKITATRGARAVELWIGRREATVDGRTVPLDVPPMLIGGYTYVPVRFPSEALGADVTWQGAQRTVLISTATMPPLDGNPLPPPAEEQPPPGNVKGVLLQLGTATPRVVLVKPYDRDTAVPYIVAPDAVYWGAEAAERALREVEPQRVQPGDDVTLAFSPDGQVVRLEARYKAVTADFQGAAGNNLLTQTGQVYQLSSDVRVARTDGTAANLTDLNPGDPIQMRTNPVSGQVWEVIALPAAVIVLVGPEGYTRPLRAGELLTVRLQGTPGGKATFDIGTAHVGVPMTEDRAGVYRGQYRVGLNEEVVDAPVVGHLVVAGARAPDAGATTWVSLDSVPPAISDVFPGPDQVISTRGPTVQCLLDDGDGTGVDPRSATISVSGRGWKLPEAPRGPVVTDTSLTWATPPLRLGPVEVWVRVADLAGNETTRDWTFTIAATGQPVWIASVTHAPMATALGLGDRLAVTLRAVPFGQRAFFEIEGLRDKALGLKASEVPMTRTAGPDADTWVGTYTVQPGDAIGDARVIGHFVDRNGVAHTLEDPARVTITPASETKLRITQPAADAQVPPAFDLVGYSVPGRRVNYEVTYEGRSVLVQVPVTGTVARGQVKAAEHGTFRVHIDIGPVLGNPLLQGVDRLKIVCTVKGPGDAVLETAEVTVTPAKQE